MDLDEIVRKVCDEHQAKVTGYNDLVKGHIDQVAQQKKKQQKKTVKKMYLLLRQKSHLITQRLSFRKKNLLSQQFLRTPLSKPRMLLPRQGQLNQCMWPPLLKLIFHPSKLFLRKVKSLASSPKLLRLMKHQRPRPLQLFSNNKLQWNNLNHLQCLIQP